MIKTLQEHLQEKIAGVDMEKVASLDKSVLTKMSHIQALDMAAQIRAEEIIKIAQELHEGGEQLTMDDLMDLVNPEGNDFLEGLVTELAVDKLQQNEGQGEGQPQQ